MSHNFWAGFWLGLFVGSVSALVDFFIGYRLGRRSEREDEQIRRANDWAQAINKDSAAARRLPQMQRGDSDPKGQP